MALKRPKSLDAPVTVEIIQFEGWAYLRCDQWKRSYRYTLVNEFRSHITETKNCIIKAFELPNKHREQKQYLYSCAMGELSIVESNMDIMVSNDFCIMSEKEYADAAKRIDNIRSALLRLINSLPKGASGSELPIFGAEGVTAGYKDA